MRFSEWIVAELERQGWSRSEAARRGGISPSMFDKVINGYNQPGIKFINGLARAFKMTPAEVMLHLGNGKISDDQESDALTEEGIHILRELEGDYKEDAIRYLRMRREVQEEKQRGNVRKRKERPATT